MQQKNKQGLQIVQNVIKLLPVVTNKFIFISDLPLFWQSNRARKCRINLEN